MPSIEVTPGIAADQGDSGHTVDQAPILVITRFSFVGSSGWQGDASRDPDLLFQPDRLARRLALFSAITLPSLAAQTDRGFQHVILTSDRLPDTAMAALNDACLRAYGGPNMHVILARPPSPARRPLRQHMEALHRGKTVVQVVLDDDDGLSTDFIALMRKDLGKTVATTPEAIESLPYFLSYPYGYGLVFNPDGSPQIYAHRYPFINLGLTMIGEASGKNILAIDHLAAPRKYGGRLIRHRKMFVRSVHPFNDSRVQPSGRWRLIEDWQADTDIGTRFAYLIPAFGAGA